MNELRSFSWARAGVTAYLTVGIGHAALALYTHAKRTLNKKTIDGHIDMVEYSVGNMGAILGGIFLWPVTSTVPLLIVERYSKQ